MIEWLSCLPNKSDFINFGNLDTLKDSPNTPPDLKFLEQRVHELVGGRGQLNTSLPLDNVMGRKRLRSGRVKFLMIRKSIPFYVF